MIKGKFTALVALVIILFAASCSKEGPNGATGLTGPIGPAGPSDTGGISGHLQLFDQYGSRVLVGLYGTQITLSTGVVTYADSNGRYLFTPVTTGAYSLYVHDTATSTLYADTRISGFQFISDTLNRDVKMSAIPSFSPTSITSVDTPGSVYVTVNFAADTRLRSCIIFLNAATATNTNYLIAYTKNIPANATKISFNVAPSEFYNAGITSGATAYLTAYGYPVSDQSVFEDISTGKMVYNAVSAAPQSTSIVVP